MQSEIDRSLESYRNIIISLDQAIPNSLLLTTSVIIVFIAEKISGNFFILISLFALTFVLLFSVLSLIVLKKASTLAYNQLTGAAEAIRIKEGELRTGNIINTEVISSEFSGVLANFSTTGLAKMRDLINSLQNSAIVLFFFGMLSLVVGVIFN